MLPNPPLDNPAPPAPQSGSDIGAQRRLLLQRNLDAIKTSRPALAAVLSAVTPDAQYTIAPSATGRPTIFSDSGGGGRACLSAAGDPLGAAAQAMAQLKPDIANGNPLALIGLGDAYLVAALAQNPPDLALGRQQPIFIIEPDPRLVLTALMLHDFTGPNGPIEQARFQWFVGADWDAVLLKTLNDDLFLPFPEINVRLGAGAVAIEAKLKDVLQKILLEDGRLNSVNRKYYESLTAADYAAVFSDHPPRPPRVLLITSRFTTVLQYSTADAAEAFAQLGWQTRTVIEPSPYHSVRRMALRKALGDFQPDLIFQIDHHRHEYGDTYPVTIPFACWVQDYLPNLTNRDAGMKISGRDFVLTSSGSHFVRAYSYPPRQIVAMPNLARLPVRPPSWSSSRPDVVYVSNWSQRTADVFRDVMNQTRSIPQLTKPIEAVCNQIIKIYNDGGCLPTNYDIRRTLCDVFLAREVCVHDSELLNSLVNLLFDRLNNQLYRHQALRWAMDICHRRNLTLELYGRGWEKNSEFARFAKGPIRPGSDFEQLVRDARINLQLEPYACFTHPRMPTGLFAGGFFLVRDNPLNRLPQELLDYVTDHFDSRVRSVEDARQFIEPARRRELEGLLEFCRCLAEQVDPIESVRAWQDCQLLRPHQPALPLMNDICFHDRQTLDDRIQYFLGHPRQRSEVAAAQRQDLETRLSYPAGLRRMIGAIGRLIAQERPVVAITAAEKSAGTAQAAA